MVSGLPSPKKARLKIYTVGESNSKWTLLYCLGLMKYVPQFVVPYGDYYYWDLGAV